MISDDLSGVKPEPNKAFYRIDFLSYFILMHRCRPGSGIDGDSL